jgi:hypothetical protein
MLRRVWISILSEAEQEANPWVGINNANFWPVESAQYLGRNLAVRMDGMVKDDVEDVNSSYLKGQPSILRG